MAGTGDTLEEQPMPELESWMTSTSEPDLSFSLPNGTTADPKDPPAQPPTPSEGGTVDSVPIAKE